MFDRRSQRPNILFCCLHLMCVLGCFVLGHGGCGFALSACLGVYGFCLDGMSRDGWHAVLGAKLK